MKYWHTEDIYTDYLIITIEDVKYVLGDVTQINCAIREDENGIKSQSTFEVITPDGNKVLSTVGIYCTVYKEKIKWETFQPENNELNDINLGLYSNRHYAKKLIENHKQ